MNSFKTNYLKNSKKHREEAEIRTNCDTKWDNYDHGQMKRQIKNIEKNNLKIIFLSKNMKLINKSETTQNIRKENCSKTFFKIKQASISV